MVEDHAETQSMMKEGFVGLAIQNAELNTESKEQNKVRLVSYKSHLYITSIKFAIEII